MADEEQTDAEETEVTTDAPEATEEAAPEESSAPAPAAEKAPPEPAAHPKEIRSRKRSAHRGEALPQRDAEARATERAATRKKAADDRRRYRAKHKGSDAAGEGTPEPEREPGAKKIRRGIVVSDKGDKTITVKVEVVHRHRRYEKVIRRSDTLHAHDERNEAGAGDTVRVVESRPLSRTKRWRLIEVVEKAR